MLTFIKLGGSLITDKRIEGSFKEQIVKRLANEIRSALTIDPDLRIVIGHGSGSFGHFAASRYQTIEGVHTPEEWYAFAHVARVAGQLNYLVTTICEEANLPIFRVQPSASARCHDAELSYIALSPIETAIAHRLIPLLYGDVAFDEVRGGTIVSTEKVFFYLAKHLPVSQILLLGEVEGVLDSHHTLVPEITPENFNHIHEALGRSAGVDVTGGMESKVSEMLKLVELNPTLSIRILDGTQANLLKRTLLKEVLPGTLIRASTSHAST